MTIFAAHASESFEEEHSAFVIQTGQLLLSFITTEDLIPVSWDLVRDFAQVMKGMTERGFPGGYEAVLIGGAANVFIFLGMAPSGTAVEAAR